MVITLKWVLRAGILRAAMSRMLHEIENSYYRPLIEGYIIPTCSVVKFSVTN